MSHSVNSRSKSISWAEADTGYLHEETTDFLTRLAVKAIGRAKAIIDSHHKPPRGRKLPERIGYGLFGTDLRTADGVLVQSLSVTKSQNTWTEVATLQVKLLSPNGTPTYGSVSSDGEMVVPVLRFSPLDQQEIAALDLEYEEGVDNLDYRHAWLYASGIVGSLIVAQTLEGVKTKQKIHTPSIEVQDYEQASWLVERWRVISSQGVDDALTEIAPSEFVLPGLLPAQAQPGRY